MISIQASLPGADPATIASTVAAPLERRLGQISGVSEITSVSTLGGTAITVQFNLDRTADRAARERSSSHQCRRRRFALQPAGTAQLP